MPVEWRNVPHVVALIEDVIINIYTGHRVGVAFDKMIDTIQSILYCVCTAIKNTMVNYLSPQEYQSFNIFFLRLKIMMQRTAIAAAKMTAPDISL